MESLISYSYSNLIPVQLLTSRFQFNSLPLNFNSEVYTILYKFYRNVPNSMACMIRKVRDKYVYNKINVIYSFAQLLFFDLTMTSPALFCTYIDT